MTHPDIKGFIGRNQALEVYYGLLAERTMGSALFFYSPPEEGGVGKTLLLQHIFQSERSSLVRRVCEPIDFYETRNRKIDDVMETLVSIIGQEFFPRYIEAKRKYQTYRLQEPEPDPAQDYAMRRHGQAVFLHECNLAGQDDLVLLFDTFEAIHGTETERWFLYEFLPAMDEGPFVVFAGRHMGTRLPDKVKPFRLAEFTEEEARLFFENRRPDFPLAWVPILWEKCKHRPLFMEMVADPLYCEETELESWLSLSPDEFVDHLVGKIQQLGYDYPILLAMSYLHRRFDRDILTYLFERHSSLVSRFENVEEILRRLGRYSIVKSRVELGSHLLHDEVRLLVRTKLAKWSAGNGETQKGLLDEPYNLVVNGYYVDRIKDAFDKRGRTDPLYQQLVAERLDYMLERDATGRQAGAGMEYYNSGAHGAQSGPPPQGRRQAGAGMEYYNSEAKVAKEEGLHDFEEVLWNEAIRYRDEKTRFPLWVPYDRWVERGQWLQRAGRYRRAAGHYAQMLGIFGDDPEREMMIRSRLGYCLNQIGRAYRPETSPDKRTWLKGVTLGYAEEHYRVGLERAGERGEEIWQASFERNLGMAYATAGMWQEALHWYDTSIGHCTNLIADFSPDSPDLATVLDIRSGAQVSSGHVLSFLGAYAQAESRCQEALGFLERSASLARDKAAQERRLRAMTFANLNLATNARYTGQYNLATGFHVEAMRLAREAGDMHLQCMILQEMGINSHLAGVHHRMSGPEAKFGSEFAAASSEKQVGLTLRHYRELVRLQREAFDNLARALDMARTSYNEVEVANVLGRLAVVYMEIGELGDIAHRFEEPKSLRKSIQRLKIEAGRLILPEEEELRRELLEPALFGEMSDVVDQAARLLEVSARVGEKSRNYHRALDSWSKLAESQIWRGQYELASIASSYVAALTPRDHQGKLFNAIGTTVEGHIRLLHDGDDTGAARAYGEGFVTLAEEHGYAEALLRPRLARLKDIIDTQVTAPDRLLSFARDIEVFWRESENVAELHPEMLELLDAWKRKAIQQKLFG